MMIFFLILSILINIFCFWYIYRLLASNVAMSGAMDSICDTAEEFGKHLEEVYKKETFYGDVTLKNLLSHAKDVKEEMQSVKSQHDEYTGLMENNGRQKEE